ncbi:MULTISPECIES: EthD family reductase [unclassified Geodermatophilus]|uniref:EthD family reductase n=1 Tax=unclassified Geodermatophilus TaxID=2637632 RepID=UPI003EEF1CFC
MYRVIVNYHHPEDPQAFLEHYRTTHAPLAKNLSNVASYTWGTCETPDGSRPEYFVTAVLDWPSKEDALADLGSPQGQAATADMANFAMAGASLVSYESETVI